MGKKFLLLTLVTVMAVLFGVRAWGSGTRDASADTFNDKVDQVTVSKAGGGAINPGDAITTVVKTGLGSNLGSFYTSILTQIKGISATGAAPIGDTVGTGSFNIRLTGTLPCNSSSGNLGPSYAIYSAKLNATSTGLSEAGYANLDTTLTFPGDGSGPSAYDTTLWVADYDDDNYNNRPDYISSDSGDLNTAAQTTQDLHNAAGTALTPDGLPDGVTQEPTYIPAFEAATGLPAAAVRYFGIAPVPGNPVPVDFITYNNFPVVGTNTQYAIIFEGAGVGLTPGNPSTASIVTCPPFDSTLTFNATSTPSVATVQTLTGSGSIEVHQVTVADFDGDTVPNYNDLCDAVADPTNADTDADGIGNVCDPSPGVPAAPDADGDITLNANDSCPTTSGPVDLDDDLTAGDGVADSCDPAPTVPGDGNGYGFGYNGVVIGGSGVYSTHGTINNFAFTSGASSPITAARTETWCLISNHTATNVGLQCDAGPDTTGSGQPTSGNFKSDSDGDGYTDGCELGLALYGGIGGTGGSDPLQASSTPSGAVGGPTLNCDGDGTPDATDTTPLPATLDSDGDHCKNTSEPTHSGKPNSASNPYDFYSVPVPALLTQAPPALGSTTDAGIGVTTDVVALLKYSGKLSGSLEYDQDIDRNGIPDGVQYDRAPSTTGGQPWKINPPDGGIGVTTDVVAMLSQSGFVC